MQTPDPAKCLGIDLTNEYDNDVRRTECHFECLDLTPDEAIAGLPEAKYYLAWHCLEHVPSKDWTNTIVKACLDKATEGCWFTLPSFQQDEENGEGVQLAGHIEQGSGVPDSGQGHNQLPNLDMTFSGPGRSKVAGRK